MATLVSVGYEGRNIDDLIVELRRERVRILVDVRLNPISRKPGLSKTKLSQAVRAAGIEYFHHRALGNPRDNRDGFRSGVPESRARFRDLLASAQAMDALAHVAELLDDGVVALLCYERDHSSCHRTIIAEQPKVVAPSVELLHL